MFALHDFGEESMTRSETMAFNAGVAAVLDLALASAEAIKPRLIEKPTRYNFAIGALQALAAEGQELLKQLPPEQGTIV